MTQIVKHQGIDVRVYEQREAMGVHAAKEVGQQIIALLEEQALVNVIFASAPSQNEFLAHLSTRKDIDWTRVNAFHMDEYLGLPADAPQSFGFFLKERLFDKQPFRTANYILGNTSDAEAECQRYTRLLEQYPPDIACLGIGENGHIAFNDPPVADFNDPLTVKQVELDGECRQQQVNDGCFPSLKEVPVFALTLTIPALLAARFIYCIVPGPRKAQAIFNTLNQDIDTKYPSTILRKHPNTVLFLDKDSAGLLK